MAAGRHRSSRTRLRGQLVRKLAARKRLIAARQSLGEIEEQARLHHRRNDEFVRHCGAANWAEARDALTSAGEVARLRAARHDLASEAFRIMSRNGYSGLTAQPDGASEILVALATDGGSKHADQLSDGARAQLFLALRIAGYHEFARNSGPVPFIADDIMESFDDHRAAEAFGLLAKMSETGQVIYLTHHAHLRDMAREVCPTVQIHDLPE